MSIRGKIKDAKEDIKLIADLFYMIENYRTSNKDNNWKDNLNNKLEDFKNLNP